jgi:tRNA A-37 threonylcarbamoyl transferase component Bud32
VAAIELELVDGMDLGDWAKSADLHERMQALARIATALARLHREGLAHGDLNPAGNVRVTPERIVLLDVDSERSGGNPRDFDRISLAAAIEALLPDYSKRYWPTWYNTCVKVERTNYRCMMLQRRSMPQHATCRSSTSHNPS